MICKFIYSRGKLLKQNFLDTLQKYHVFPCVIPMPRDTAMPFSRTVFGNQGPPQLPTPSQHCRAQSWPARRRPAAAAARCPVTADTRCQRNEQLRVRAAGPGVLRLGEGRLKMPWKTPPTGARRQGNMLGTTRMTRAGPRTSPSSLRLGHSKPRRRGVQQNEARSALAAAQAAGGWW